MDNVTVNAWSRVAWRALFGALILIVMILAGTVIARAGEIIPSVGVTKAVNDDNADAKVYGGLAVRGNILPMLKSEIGIAYRHETRLDGNLDVRMVPLTASLWLTPIPTLYAGGGVGWYYTRLDWNETMPFQDETTQKFGVHLGGGLAVPLGPSAALDLNGRYVFLEKQESALPPANFDPDFWSTTVGLAIKF
jgi:hypothetical protein